MTHHKRAPGDDPPDRPVIDQFTAGLNSRPHKRVRRASQIQSFFEFRIAVEGTALKKLALCHDDNMIEELEAFILKAEEEAQEREVNISRLAELFFLYQRSICVFSGNEFFPPLFNEFKPIILQFWESSIRRFGAVPNVRLARKYLSDIIRGDAQAAMNRLIRSSETYVSSQKID